MLKIEHLRKVYGSKVAVDDLSLHIQRGEIYGFIGHNGAGKTTTIKACCGILTPDAGSIEINGRSIFSDPVGCKRELAYIPDNPDLYNYMTGLQYLGFIADIFGIAKSERAQRIEHYADIFGIKSDLPQSISSYSHGMKQKLAVIAALIHAD